MDAEGSIEWNAMNLASMDAADREKVELGDGCCGDQMWLEMFEAAVKKAADAMSDVGEEEE